ncbi:hypothetical protein LINPERHAP1_LOCUS23111 [Linum perenne]
MCSREDVEDHDKANAFWTFWENLEQVACPKIAYALLLERNTLVHAKLFVVIDRVIWLLLELLE